MCQKNHGTGIVGGTIPTMQFCLVFSGKEDILELQAVGVPITVWEFRGKEEQKFIN